MSKMSIVDKLTCVKNVNEVSRSFRSYRSFAKNKLTFDTCQKRQQVTSLTLEQT